ncbi:hypothetical protein FOLKNPGA_01276 [Legionella sp. PC1000]|nr:alpha/beta fold hydrolase [Legionella sp. PC1000]QLZ68497.1 hypothetical protein FOLKNPGA_01276 [Legionella sp. PC1000]
MHYLLVHGSWHGMWCWDKLVPHLYKQGHSVSRFDLPGSGSRFSEINDINFEILKDSVEAEIHKINNPFCLVVHSFAGLLAAPLVEKYVHKIHHAFYLAAWLPREGKSLIDMAVAYNNSELPSIFIHTENPLWSAIDPEASKNIFYHDCTLEDQIFASQRIKPKNKLPDLTPQRAVANRKSLNKSTYILCNHDKVVHPESQLDIAKRFGFDNERILTFPSGHSPFLAKPYELARILSQSC